MIELSLDDKRTLILEYEKSRARELARLVIEKPVPPVWMIFIPVFFIFYAWKIREYSSGLKDFSKHYLVSRNRALDIAYEAEKTGKLEEIDDLAENNYPIPSQARPAYRRWLSLLVDHYRNLLTAGSSSIEGLIRAHYRNKATFMLTNNQLRTAEAAFNSALLPKIEGDSQDIRYVFEKMERSLTDLYRREVDDVFP